MISIIVPIYKVEKYLPKCIDSLTNQTLSDIEIILVNDGSPDKCPTICNEYARKDKRIKVIHQPNSGVSTARNTGLDAAHGEYIGFCDPDDFVAPEMYETMLRTMENNQVDLVACGYEYYDESYRRDDKRTYSEANDEIMSRETIFSRLADMPPTIRHGVVTKLFRKSSIDNLRFNVSLHSSEDANFLMDYLKCTESAVFIHKPLYMNLVRQGSATHGALNIQSLKDSFKVHDRMYRETVKEFPHLKSKAIAFLLDVCTLKYNESKDRGDKSDSINALLGEMRCYIRRKSLTAIGSRHIKWKTKIYYLLLWIRK